MVGLGIHPGRLQAVGDLDAGLAATAVHHRRQPVLLAQERAQHLGLPGLAGHADDLEEEVRAIEAGARRGGILQPERLDDVLRDLRRGGGGERDGGRRSQALAHVSEPPVVGPEVVAPLRQAVGLVHRQPRDVGGRQRIEETAAGEPLGGDVDQPRVTLLDAHERGRDLLGRHARVEHLDALEAARHERCVLILHERDERRDDHREPRAEHGRKLIAERLARPRGHDREHVTALEHGLHRLALSCAKLGEAEPLVQLAVDVQGGGAHTFSVADGVDTPPDQRCQDSALRGDDAEKLADYLEAALDSIAAASSSRE